jgi:hypothetical protein
MPKLRPEALPGNEPRRPTNDELADEAADIALRSAGHKRQLEELREAVRDLMAYWPELDNIPEENQCEYEIIVYAPQMKRLKELIDA